MVEVTELQIRYGMSPAMAQIAKLLLEQRIVTCKEVEVDHHITVDAKVFFCRLRKAYKPLGATIHSRRMLGYWMDESDKRIILDGLEKFPGQGETGEEPREQASPDTAQSNSSRDA